MYKNGPDTEQTNRSRNSLFLDYAIARLSNDDPQVRKSAAIALGGTGDKRAVESLISSLSRELARDTGSFPIIIEILDALWKMPDRRALDMLVEIESRVVDRDSDRIPAGLLSTGLITYTDPADGLVHLAVTREVHFKILDSMRMMSGQLNDRVEQISACYDAYQFAIIQAEISRIMPDMAELLQGNDGPAAPLVCGGTMRDRGDASPASEGMRSDAMPADVEAFLSETETEIADFFHDDEKMRALIRQGQYIKALIRQKRAETAKARAIITNADRVRAPC